MSARTPPLIVQCEVNRFDGKRNEEKCRIGLLGFQFTHSRSTFLLLFAFNV